MKVVDLFMQIEEIAFKQKDVEEKDFTEMEDLLATMPREDMIELVLEFMQIVVRADVDSDLIHNPYQNQEDEMKPNLRVVH